MQADGDLIPFTLVTMYHKTEVHTSVTNLELYKTCHRCARHLNIIQAPCWDSERSSMLSQNGKDTAKS